MKPFKAYVVNKHDDSFTRSIQTVSLEDLSPGNVIIKTAYSSINYKDTLAVNPKGGVIRNYPMIPGIDASGIVVESTSDMFNPGDPVFVIGYEFGVSHTGAFSEYIRIPSTWVKHIPAPLSLKDIMKYGTAGLTAGLSVQALLDHGITPDHSNPILVTGATGGVGSIALSILSKLGFNVHALTRKKDTEASRLLSLGASQVYTLEEITHNNTKPLAKQTYHGIVDTVGGDIASALIPFLHYKGVMTLCGQVGGVQLNTTVFPLILRGITLAGIDAVYCDDTMRDLIWHKLAHEWRVVDTLISQEESFEDIDTPISKLVEGTHTGRTIVHF
ncbi:hypothetical protein AOC36_02665 [Erysipelothrix larvae]|uniref:Enoyl reductase (ER) domain-containing protein n=1 Tax=Erysipelothrix larvae TaxID=1514105 RepID=A0A120JTH6_9FIRM|nr:YhdH/YhfP family quinone oxidoreductase [Erysipelothrix larvae]AMC92925.1 hypothetical protein AOC36_02665 [Erysipelothrix larvae]